MDDFNVSSLHESRNEWTSRLVTILTPLIIEGLKSIFDEANKLCKENGEHAKYLLTFQNFISRIPHWNANIIETERKRITERSGCSYLQDLITCTHIIQLKLLTAIRAGNKQKKIDINIPKLDDFIHKTYIHVARKIYKNVYLFENGIPPLQMQKNNRELEIIIQECILNSIRESIPVESILRAYMDESVEEEVIEEVKEQVVEDPKVSVQKEIENEIKKEISKSIETEQLNLLQLEKELPKEPTSSGGDATAPSISFSEVDFVKNTDGTEEQINVPKESFFEPPTLESSENTRLNITDQSIELDDLDVHVIPDRNMELLPDLLIDNIEVLG
jgi:Family of unknown function (DUF5764)